MLSVILLQLQRRQHHKHSDVKLNFAGAVKQQRTVSHNRPVSKVKDLSLVIY